MYSICTFVQNVQYGLEKTTKQMSGGAASPPCVWRTESSLWELKYFVVETHLNVSPAKCHELPTAHQALSALAQIVQSVFRPLPSHSCDSGCSSNCRPHIHLFLQQKPVGLFLPETCWSPSTVRCLSGSVDDWPIPDCRSMCCGTHWSTVQPRLCGQGPQSEGLSTPGVWGAVSSGDTPQIRISPRGRGANE